jgi:DNA-binding LacI/PurR family transcriptional regulator
MLATLLIDRIEGVRTEPPERICPPFQLIVRQSSSA